jgi:hypothetical protein
MMNGRKKDSDRGGRCRWVGQKIVLLSGQYGGRPDRIVSLNYILQNVLAVVIQLFTK